MRLEQLPIKTQKIIQNELDQWLDEDKVQVISPEERIKELREGGLL